MASRVYLGERGNLDPEVIARHVKTPGEQGPTPPDRPDLPDLINDTASEYMVKRRLWMDYEAHLTGTPSKTPSAEFGLVPPRQNLPEASLKARIDPLSREKDASLYVGIPERGGEPYVGYSREVLLPEEGREVHDRVEGGIGDVLRAHFMESTFPGGEGTEYRGSVNAGPFTLFGEGARTRQNVIPEANRRYYTNSDVDATTATYGFHGAVPVGIGTLRGGAARTNRYSDLPQVVGQEERHRVQAPRVTRFNLGYDRPVGKGNFGIGAWFEDMRDLGTSKGLGANLEIPLGPGIVSMKGVWENLYGAPSNVSGMAQFKIPLGE
jgi:hypothetical protein